MTVHIAAQHVVVDGRYVRQRCAWCGAVLVDVDAERIAVPIAMLGPEMEADPASIVGTWPTGRLVQVEGEFPKVTTLLDESHRYPPDACMALDPEVTA